MKLASALLTTLLATSLAACDSDDPEDMPPPELRVTADTTEVAQGGTITLTIEVENFELTHEGEHMHLELEDDLDLRSPDAPALAEETYDGPRIGHVHVYLDDVMTNPLAMITTETGEVVIDAEPGAHTLINRLHAADHTIIEPQIIHEIDINVLAP